MNWQDPQVQASRPSLRRYFVTGLIIVLPTLLTLYIVWMLFSLVGGLLSPFLGVVLRGVVATDLAAPLTTLLSVLVTATLIYLVGMTGTLFSQRIFQWAETVFARIPVVRGIYTSVRQLTDLFAVKDASFKKVALVEFPREGIYSLCFITSRRRFDIPGRPGRAVSVLIPTAPVPTAGFFLLVPEEEIIPVDISVDEAMKMIISGGAITPLDRAPLAQVAADLTREQINR
ncbi:MAG: DUF502 domain-containing protein [candidate division NC10 bacterium]|nr:DUF502 domain-containing protein [candidate division NC10 bacterium]